MTGSAVDRARAPGGVARTADERQWDHLWRLANVYAKTALVPKDMQEKPEVVMAALLLCDALGADPRTAISQLHLIEGKLEPSAQMYLGLAAANGYETRWEQLDDEAAVLLIRPAGRADWERIGFTIGQARQAGLLDEWVEHWVRNDSGKSHKETFVLGQEGVDVPGWAAALIKAGQRKHKDNWWKYPADMLAARAAKRAVKRCAPHLLMGVGNAAARAATVTAEVLIEHDDDDVLDCEIVPDPPAGADADAGPGTPDIERPGPASATKLERQLLWSLINQLDGPGRDRLRARAKNAGLPNIESHQFTGDSGHQLLMLIGEVKAEQSDTATATPAVAGEAANGSGPVEGPGHEAADDNPGREFD